MKASTPVLSGFCNPSWSLDTKQGRKSHAMCLKADCPCTCGLGMVHGGGHSTPVDELEPPSPVEGISVVYTRHGDESFQAGWHCREDAELFADWLRDCGAAVEVEVVEL